MSLSEPSTSLMRSESTSSAEGCRAAWSAAIASEPQEGSAELSVAAT
jgi:hypothetical protein